VKLPEPAKKVYRFFSRFPALWCFASGAGYSVAYFYPAAFCLCFLFLFLFYLCLFKKNPDGSVGLTTSLFKRTFFFGIGFFVPLYSWFFALYPFEAFGFTPAEGLFIVFAAIIGLSSLHSAVMAAVFLLSKLYPKKIYLAPAGFAFNMMIFEYVNSRGSAAFPWGTAALGQYRFSPFIQNISLFGPLFITLSLSFIAGYASLFALSRGKKHLLTSAAAFILPLITGFALLLTPTEKTHPIKAASLQGDIPSMEKWDKEKKNKIIDEYFALAKEAAESGGTLIVLPESAIPYGYTDEVEERFALLAKEYTATVLMSSVTTRGDKTYNSVFALNYDSSPSEIYSKQHLVPFGEYLPLSGLFTKLLPFVNGLNLAKEPFSPGESGVTITLPDSTKLGCLVCFDSIFPSLARDSVNSGGELLIVSTNDSWFKDSSAVYQHLGHSALRAIETGKYVVRAANTGISAFITPKGEILSPTKPLTKAITICTVYPNKTKTLYARVGDIIMAAPVLFVIYSLWLWVKNRKNPEKSARLRTKAKNATKG